MIGRRVFILMLLLGWALPLHAAPEYPSMGPDIFDRQTKGEVLIEQAVARAQQENKRIVVLFGANWCPWCRRLHRAFTEAPAVQARLRDDFVLVYIDANFRNDRKRNAAVLERYGDPIKKYGLPVLVVLDRDGTQLTTQETNALAAPADEDTAKRIADFLAKWAPPKAR
jgi:thioredoxin-related protein